MKDQLEIIAKRTMAVFASIGVAALIGFAITISIHYTQKEIEYAESAEEIRIEQEAEAKAAEASFTSEK